MHEPEIVNIMQGLLRGLKYMSEKGVSHRDLKPANIMLKKTIGIVPEDVVIVDFGLAASLSDTNPIFKRCGTPGYIAPEVIAMNTSPEEPFKIPEKCDIFSIGVIMYALCAEYSPFDDPDDSPDAILRRTSL